jgi:hypothetical protein
MTKIKVKERRRHTGVPFNGLFDSLILCFFVSLFLCFFVSLFLCFFVSLFLCFFVSAFFRSRLQIWENRKIGKFQKIVVRGHERKIVDPSGGDDESVARIFVC